MGKHLSQFFLGIGLKKAAAANDALWRDRRQTEYDASHVALKMLENITNRKHCRDNHSNGVLLYKPPKKNFLCKKNYERGGHKAWM